MKETKYTVKLTSSFKKDYKLALRSKKKIELLDDVIGKLACGLSLPESCKDHSLSGNWKKYRECHIQPDWVLIYRIEENILVLTLTRTGSHSNLFGL